MNSLRQPYLRLRTGTAARLLAIAGISLFAPSLFAATAIWNGTVGGGDGFWDPTANTEWSGVTGNAWDATNGPTNVAQFNTGAAGSNPVTSGTVVANGLIWNGVGGGISGGAGVKLDGANPFINVNTAGLTSQMYANLTGTNGFTKTGAGQFFLYDSVKGITGGITVNQGLLRLDVNSAATASGVANSSNAITLSGATLELQGRGGGNVSSQTLDNFTLNTGGSIIKINQNGGSSVTLSLKNWTRTAGTNSSIYIDTSSGSGTKLTLTGTLPAAPNGIIGGYATIKDNTGYGFATLSGNDVVRYTGATTVNAALGANTVSTTNYKSTGSGAYFNGTATTQYLNSLEHSVNNFVGGNAAATFVVGSGGVMMSATGSNNKIDLNLTSATSELQISTVGYNSGWEKQEVRGVKDNGGASVSLVKAGPGALSLGTGTFTYTGDTVVNQGYVVDLTNIPSGTGKGNLVVNNQTSNNSGIVNIGVPAAGGIRTINGLSNTTVSGGTVTNINIGGTGAGAAAVSFLDLGNNNATATFSGVIDKISIIKSGTGTQTFSGANTYAGTTQVNAGTLQFAKTSSLYNNTPASWTAANINVRNGATLAINVGGTGEFTTGNVTTLLTNLAASSSSTNGMNAGSSLGFDTTNASGGTFIISDVIANTTGASGGARSVSKLGTGTLALTGNNSFTGLLTIWQGTLLLGNGGITGSLSPSSNILNQGNLEFNRSDDIDQGTAFGSSITGTGKITQSGAGTTKLNGTNDFTGVTEIKAGKINAAAADVLKSTSNIILTGGTLLLSGTGNRINDSAQLTLSGGKLDSNGLSETFGNLTTTADTTIDLGAGVSILTFNSGGSTAWSGVLKIWNWTDGFDKILFTSNASNGNVNLANIQFYSDSGSTSVGAGSFINGGTELVPVPEPTAVLSALSLLGIVAVRECRRRAK
jgi:fibronectin-binding autotransporter adhesin